MYESLKKLMNDSKNKKKAFQEVFKIYNDIYIYNKEKSKYDYQASSYFNLVRENPKLTYKKTFTREARYQGNNFHEQIKVIKTMYGVEVTKYQPYYIL